MPASAATSSRRSSCGTPARAVDQSDIAGLQRFTPPAQEIRQLLLVHDLHGDRLRLFQPGIGDPWLSRSADGTGRADPGGSPIHGQAVLSRPGRAARTVGAAGRAPACRSEGEHTP